MWSRIAWVKIFSIIGQTRMLSCRVGPWINVRHREHKLYLYLTDLPGGTASRECVYDHSLITLSFAAIFTKLAQSDGQAKCGNIDETWSENIKQSGDFVHI